MLTEINPTATICKHLLTMKQPKTTQQTFKGETTKESDRNEINFNSSVRVKMGYLRLRPGEQS